ncbi:MAG TPA: hypothetical protein DEB06_09840, partial [Phycisphaerales bacterium]|nr:hypothetical protein [Phycisphaerales bacterium]
LYDCDIPEVPLATPTPAFAQPDIRLCQLWGLTMRFGNPLVSAREGDTVGFALGTTSWNVGTQNVSWLATPNPNHPFIAQNLYRLQNGRFEQIGQAWVKHGFFALRENLCNDPTCIPGGTNGQQLFVGCTDPYEPSLNGTQSALGPRYEINPWTGAWSATGSVFATGMTNTKVTRRLQVRDADLVAFDSTVMGGNPTGVRYFIEGYYVAADDRNAMNSAAWKEVLRITGSPGNDWSVQTGNSASADQLAPVNVGFAINAWGARQTLVAQDPVIVEHVSAPLLGVSPSPDGRAIIHSKVTDNADGTWRYNYALHNIDMDRQIGSFSVPIPTGVQVTNVGSFHVRHHDEPYAWSEFISGTGRVHGKPINNDPWTSSVAPGSVSWSTPDVNSPTPSNPVRWGTIHNFWFDADSPPTDALVTLGLFKAGSPASLQGLTDGPSVVPEPCTGDANSDATVDFDDITTVLAHWLTSYAPGTGPGDADGNGVVDFDDITTVLSHWLDGCP